MNEAGGLSKKHGSIQSLFGDGNILHGNLYLSTPLRIDGIIKGDILTQSRLHISYSGRVEGKIQAKNMEIGGHFSGRLYVEEKLVLRSGAVVSAEVRAFSMEVEDGAFYIGNCLVGKKIERQINTEEHASQENFFQENFSDEKILNIS